MTRILLEGIGGVGGVIAGELMSGGYEPVLVTGNPNIAETINKDGLTIKTPERSFNVKPKAYADLADLPEGEPFDFALLAMKATAVMESVRKTMPLLKPEGYVVTLQNGLVEDEVAEEIGAERLISGIIGWGATMHAPGNYERTSKGGIHIGELDKAPIERTLNLARLLSNVTPVDVSANIRGALWSKMGINCTITTIGALTGDTLGQMLKDKRVRLAFLAAYREVLDTADSLAVKVEAIATNPRLLYVRRNASFTTRLMKDILVRVVGLRYGKLKSSMLQSLERGRKTEIDYLNGYVVKKASETGFKVPCNEALVRLIKEIEQGTRKIERANLDELLAALN